MSTDSHPGWLAVYRIYLVIATVLCVVAPFSYVFRGAISDLTHFGSSINLTFIGSSVVRIIVFVAAVSTASRLDDRSIRQFHLSLNAAGAIFGLLYVLWQIISLLPFLPEVVGLLGRFVVVPWSVLIPNGMYQLYPVLSVFGLVAASIWTFLLATHDSSRVVEQTDSYDDGYHQPGNHQRSNRSRRPWLPLLISFLFALAVNLVPLAVINYDNQEYGWLLYFITIPVGGVVLVIGLIWSIVLVSNKH